MAIGHAVDLLLSHGYNSVHNAATPRDYIIQLAGTNKGVQNGGALIARFLNRLRDIVVMNFARHQHILV